MYGKRRRSTAAVKRRRIRRKRIYRRKRSLVTKATMYRAIQRTKELKRCVNTYSYTLFNSSIAGLPGDVIALMPTMSRGTQENQRIGNTISPVALVIRGYFNYYSPSGAAYKDARVLGVRLFMYHDRTTYSYNNSVVNYNLIDNGNTGGLYDGSITQHLAPHNNNQFIFYSDKRYKILKPYGVTNSTTPTWNDSMQNPNATLFHSFKKTIRGKSLPRVLRYDETDGANWPTNWAPVLSMGYCDLTGAAADTTVTQIGMSFVATLYYTDA